MRHRFVAVLAVALTSALLGGLALAAADMPTYPETPRRAVTDTYHGSAVTESYRWLEDLGSPEVSAWITQQNALTRSIIDRLPSRAGIGKELDGLMTQAATSRRELKFAGGRLFALKRQPSMNQPQLVA